MANYWFVLLPSLRGIEYAACIFYRKAILSPPQQKKKKKKKEEKWSPENKI